MSGRLHLGSVARGVAKFSVSRQNASRSATAGLTATIFSCRPLACASRRSSHSNCRPAVSISPTRDKSSVTSPSLWCRPSSQRCFDRLGVVNGQIVVGIQRRGEHGHVRHPVFVRVWANGAHLADVRNETSVWRVFRPCASMPENLVILCGCRRQTRSPTGNWFDHTISGPDDPML